MWIRKRTYGTKYGLSTHYHVVESYRENGKVRQRYICNLGEHPTAEDALSEAEQKLKEYLELERIEPEPDRDFPSWQELRRSNHESHIRYLTERVEQLKSVVAKVR